MTLRRTLSIAAVAAAILGCGLSADAKQLPVLDVTVPTARLLKGADVAAAGAKAARAFVRDPSRGVAPIGVADQSLPAGTVTMETGDVQAFGADYLNVPVRISVDGRLARTVMAGFRVTTYALRPVAARDIPAGAIITAADLTLRRMPIATPETTLDALIGRGARVAIAAGAALEPWQTRTIDVVHPGELVVLVVRDGNVALSADVVARSAGGVGDTVSVFDERAGRTTNAVVTAPGKVELRLQEVGT